MKEIIEFLALINGDKYCPCCGDSVEIDGALCDDCEELTL